MTLLKASTKRGQEIILRGKQYRGNTLLEVYASCSSEKQSEYKKCYKKYLATPEHSAWRICSRNTWMFTVSWLGLYDGENALFYETNKNSYVVLLDR